MQAAAVIFSAFTPMNIYMSHYVSNEPLSATLIGTSILITALILSSSKASNRLHIILGAAVAAALLTKFTGVLLLLLIPFIFIYDSLAQKRSLKAVPKKLLFVFVPVILLAGWFYLKNFIHYKNPIIGNWDRELGFHWWLDPGYHTVKYFFTAPIVFSSPYLSSFHSFFDSIYSTLWNDGLLAGCSDVKVAPPWNYTYGASVYLLAIPASLLIIAGTVRAVWRILQDKHPLWLLIIASVFLGVFSLIYMNLKLPYYAQAKAFYCLFLVMPVSLLFAFGYDWLNSFLQNFKLTLFQAALFAWFVTLCIVIFLSFLVKQPLVVV